MKIWFFEILWVLPKLFSRHSSRESRAHCASENIGASDGGIFVCLECSLQPVCRARTFQDLIIVFFLFKNPRVQILKEPRHTEQKFTF